MREAIEHATRSWGWVVLAVVVACGARQPSVYVPERSAGRIDGLPAGSYPVPPERPEGEVRVASFGVTELRLDDERLIPALHVRMIVENNGDRPWQVALSEQAVDFPGVGRSGPIVAFAEGGAQEVVVIPPGEQTSVDLYFPVPGGVRDNRDLARFDLLWRVDAERRISSRTSFDRVEVRDPSSDYYVVVASPWGPYWWWDPTFRYPSWYRPIVIIEERPRHIRVRRHGAPRYRPQRRDHR